jgi:hypothetical protein
MINLIILIMLVVPAAITLVYGLLLAWHYVQAEEGASGVEGGPGTDALPLWRTLFEPEAVLAWSAFSLALLIVSLHS